MGLGAYLCGHRLCFLLVSPGPASGALHVVRPRGASLERTYEPGYCAAAVADRAFYPRAVLLAAAAVGLSSADGGECGCSGNDIRLLHPHRSREKAVGATRVVVGDAVASPRAPRLEPRICRPELRQRVHRMGSAVWHL